MWDFARTSNRVGSRGKEEKREKAEVQPAVKPGQDNRMASTERGKFHRVDQK